MAQTISEFEKERAGLLKAIESQAQQMSSTRSDNSEEPPEHTLNDWLNAAEDVMPSKIKSKSKPSTAAPNVKISGNTKSSFFGVIIMLSLLLTILGVIYIAYTSIHNELKEVMTLKQASSADMKTLQESIKKLEAAVASKGQGDAFIALQEKVANLEKTVNQLKDRKSVV